jgi:hypothetical protein
MFLYLLSHHMDTTYLQSVCNLGHLDLILAAAVRVVRKGLRCSPDAFGKEKGAALCSEASEEDALIRILVWIFLLNKERN